MAAESGERIVEVAWEDTSQSHGWQSEEKAAIDPWICHSVGYVLEDNKKHIRIMESSGQPTAAGVTGLDHGCATSIPRSAIRKVTELARKR